MSCIKEDQGITPDGWGEQMQCPKCLGEYIHQGKPYKKFGLDSHQAWEGKGDQLIIPFTCEEGCTFAICVGEDKGNSFLIIK